MDRLLVIIDVGTTPTDRVDPVALAEDIVDAYNDPREAPAFRIWNMPVDRLTLLHAGWIPEEQITVISHPKAGS